MTQEPKNGIEGFELNLQELLAIGEEEVNGVRMKVYKNRVKTLRELVENSIAVFGGQEFIIYQDQRITYREFGRLVSSG
ncbi:MAG: hypothetical protein JRF41_02960 [Deltaproteobacteria bacterium]|nr:hypothetical protein [Deltaproteobacteria bacterium]